MDQFIKAYTVLRGMNTFSRAAALPISSLKGKNFLFSEETGLQKSKQEVAKLSPGREIYKNGGKSTKCIHDS